MIALTITLAILLAFLFVKTILMQNQINEIKKQSEQRTKLLENALRALNFAINSYTEKLSN